MADTFTVTLAKATLIVKAQEAGLDPYNAEGTLPETHGVELSYKLDNLTNTGVVTVTFTVLKRPHLISVGMIQGHVKSLLGVTNAG